jgi:hypothetical protein
MNTYYILRKANGDVLTTDVDGKTHVAVWNHPDAVRRSKQANPGLVVYVSAVLDHQLIERRFPNKSASFFLIDSRDPDLQTGREMSQSDFFASSELAQAA